MIRQILVTVLLSALYSYLKTKIDNNRPSTFGDYLSNENPDRWQTDGHTDRQTNRQTDRRTNRQTDRQTEMGGIFLRAVGKVEKA